MASSEPSQLIEAISKLHGCVATWVEDVPVRDHFGGDVVWDGEVSVFSINHPQATRAYAWSYVVDEATQRRRFITVLGIPPVNTPVDAVRAAIASGQQT